MKQEKLNNLKKTIQDSEQNKQYHFLMNIELMREILNYLDELKQK